MPLMIHIGGPYAAPMIVCDHCGNAITRAQDGQYQWPHAAGIAEGQRAPMVFTHTTCCDAFEQAHGGGWGAIGLEALPALLATHLHIPWSQATAKARQISRR